MTLHDFEKAKDFFKEGMFYYAALCADASEDEYRALRAYVSEKDLKIYDEAWKLVMSETNV